MYSNIGKNILKPAISATVATKESTNITNIIEFGKP
jgi:hypothetical protein